MAAVLQLDCCPHFRFPVDSCCLLFLRSPPVRVYAMNKNTHVHVHTFTRARAHTTQPTRIRMYTHVFSHTRANLRARELTPTQFQVLA